MIWAEKELGALRQNWRHAPIHSQRYTFSRQFTIGFYLFCGVSLPPELFPRLFFPPFLAWDLDLAFLPVTVVLPVSVPLEPGDPPVSKETAEWRQATGSIKA
jgi:hypothetical protein